MAPVLKRLTIDSTGSTSSMGTGRWVGLNSIRPRSVHSRVDWSSTSLAVLLEHAVVVAARGVLQLVDGERVEEVLLAVLAVLVVAADAELLVLMGRLGGYARSWRCRTSWATTSMPTPPMRVGVQVKYSSTKSWLRPIASKTWAPW